MERHWSDLLKPQVREAKPFWLGCFGFLIDDTFRNSSQSFVCCFLFAQGFLEQRSCVSRSQLFGPSSERTVP